MWQSTMPGSAVRPPASITWASLGSWIARVGPTLAMRAPSIRITPFATGSPPRPSMMRAPVIASMPAVDPSGAELSSPDLLVGDGERPDHGKALENGVDRVVEGEPLARGLSAEIAAVGGKPPRARPVALALIPRETVVDRAERLDRDLGGAPDAARRARAVDHHDAIANRRQRCSAIGIVAQQRDGRALGARDHELDEFGRHRGVVAERGYLVVDADEARMAHERLPKCVGRRCLGRYVHPRTRQIVGVTSGR